MYRTHSGYKWSCDRDVQGEWSPTALEARASYKAALKQYRERPRSPVIDFERAFTA